VWLANLEVLTIFLKVLLQKIFNTSRFARVSKGGFWK